MLVTNPKSEQQPLLRQLANAEEALAWLGAQVSQTTPGQLRTDSRQVLPGDVFLAWPGAAQDGRQHVGAALHSGAVACLVEADGAGAWGFNDPRVATLPSLKAAAGALAHACNGKPSEALHLLAVTGTNGKTSTSWWLAQALSALGTRCAVMGTLGVGEVRHAAAVAASSPALQSTGLTTPDAVALHAALRVMREAGVQACALEASSIGIEEQRLNALHIEVALFTNLTQDHLDYHHTMARYGAAKRRLFSWPGLRAAVVNIDDAFGARLAVQVNDELKDEVVDEVVDEVADEVVDESRRGPLQLWTVALDGAPARLQGLQLRYSHEGLTFDVQEAGGERATVRSALVGRFNASNLLLVLGGLRAMGVPLQAACAALATLQPVPGRMQRVSVDADAHSDVEVVVDYAHTPDALQQVLQALAPLAAARSGQLWCVVGCGGDRDSSKRPLMGAAAAHGAQQVVLTSDNPRSEDPAHILQQMLAGLTGLTEGQQRVLVIEDRRAAITHAVLSAAPGDVVLLAGKGHEQTQEVNGVKRPFSDEEEARQALLQRAAASTLHKVAAC